MSQGLLKDRPLCPQICEQICVSIAKGEFKQNQKLLSVREVAVNLNINPNTVQKAFTELEGMGLIYSIRGSGFYVSEDCAKAVEIAEQIKKQKTVEYINSMKSLGVSLEEIKNIIKEWEN